MSKLPLAIRRVVVGSSNPVKVEATRRGLRRLLGVDGFEIVGVEVPSGVADQPASDAETLCGAENRCRAAAALPDFDLSVGIEGGVEDTDRGLLAFAWVVVQAGSLVGQARSGTFALPPPVAHLVRQGVELGDADDVVFGRSDSKRREGAVGLLSGGVIDRAALYEHAVVLALLPLRNVELYGEGRPPEPLSPLR